MSLRGDPQIEDCAASLVPHPHAKPTEKTKPSAVRGLFKERDREIREALRDEGNVLEKVAARRDKRGNSSNNHDNTIMTIAAATNMFSATMVESEVGPSEFLRSPNRSRSGPTSSLPDEPFSIGDLSTAAFTVAFDIGT